MLENFKAVFLDTIINILNDNPIIKANTAPHFFKGKYYLLTSINSPAAQIKNCAQRILKNERISFSAYEADFIINENHDGELKTLAARLRDYDEKKFFNPKELSFMKKVDAVAALNS